MTAQPAETQIWRNATEEYNVMVALVAGVYEVSPGRLCLVRQLHEAPISLRDEQPVRLPRSEARSELR